MGGRKDHTSTHTQHITHTPQTTAHTRSAHTVIVHKHTVAEKGREHTHAQHTHTTQEKMEKNMK